MDSHPELGQKDASIWRAGQDGERGSRGPRRQAFTRRKTADGVGGSREIAAERSSAWGLRDLSVSGSAGSVAARRQLYDGRREKGAECSSPRLHLTLTS